MKYIFMTIYSIFVLLSSACKVGTKFCINCKFYKKDFLTFSEFGKCAQFPYENYNNYFLVNGKDYNNKNFHYCSTARQYDHMCGKEAKFYEEKSINDS
jgi:hypothetical protein